MGRASSSRSERRPRLQLMEELGNHEDDHSAGAKSQGGKHIRWRGGGLRPSLASLCAPFAGPALPAEGEQEPNPLASLLDYDEDSIEGEEQEETALMTSEAAAPEPDPGSSLGPAAGGLQAQLDSFLSELASSGLLGEGGAGGVVQQHASPQHGQRQEQGTVQQRREECPASAPAPAAATQQAEQRVLREAAGAEGWVKVLDTGSGHSYYWQQETGQVRWTPPQGALEEEETGAERQLPPLPLPQRSGSRPASAPASAPTSRGASPAPGSQAALIF